MRDRSERKSSQHDAGIPALPSAASGAIPSPSDPSTLRRRHPNSPAFTLTQNLNLCSAPTQTSLVPLFNPDLLTFIPVRSVALLVLAVLLR